MIKGYNKLFTSKKIQIMSLLKKVLLITLMIEIVYLLLFNLALKLPITQTLVNQIKPEKFQVHWDNAWTLYPFRVHASHVSANGQSNSQQWQVELDDASASIALLALIARQVKIYNIDGVNIEYFQRPRQKSHQDFTKIAQQFPVIKNREISKAIETPKKKKSKSWSITLENINAEGKHQFWIYQAKGGLKGKVHMNLSIDTKDGTFSVYDSQLDIMLDSLSIGNEQNILKQSYIRGDVEIAPVIFSQNKGIKSLAFISIDADIKTEVGSLDFLDLYLQAFQGMKLSGQGYLQGHLQFEKGKILADTKLIVDAGQLSVDLLDYKIAGKGRINLAVDSKKPDDLEIGILFSELNTTTIGIDKKRLSLFSGKDLSLTAKGSSALFPIESRASLVTYLGLEVPSMEVKDLSVYQQYIPDKWRFNINGGNGKLQAKADLSSSTFKANLLLTSNDAHLGIAEHQFSTDLELALVLNVPSFKSAYIDVSGSYLRFDDSKISKNSNVQQSIPWYTKLSIDKGSLKLNLPEQNSISATQGQTEIKTLAKALKQQKLKRLLSELNAELKINGQISQLEWINYLLKKSSNLSFSGSSQLTGDLKIVSGWPSKGSQINVKSENLQVSVLDYLISGDGLIKFNVEKGGETPDIKLSLKVIDASLKRHDEEQAFIDNIVLKVDALASNLSFKGLPQDLEIHMQIPSGKITDMSVYNQYFPKQSLIQFVEGEADLNADILLSPQSAKGYVNLKTQNLQIQVDEQQVLADLSLAINLADGIPSEMKFNIDGSSIVLDKVRVSGEHKDFNTPDWSATIYLKKAQTVWRKPISIHSEAELEIKDSRPVVAVISNQRGKHGWISKLLTMEDIKGTAQLNIEHNEIIIPYAFVKSDKVDLGAKGIINKDSHDGVFYARFKKLKGILKIEDGQRNFDIINAKKKFDNYSTTMEKRMEK